MLINLKNKDTLEIDEFKFKCSIGKNGLKKKKIEGDKSTPIGLFDLGLLYYRPDRVPRPQTLIKTKIIKCTKKTQPNQSVHVRTSPKTCEHGLFLIKGGIS